MGEDGTNRGRAKLDDLRNNSNYMRKELIDMGLHVYGNYDSPVIPVRPFLPRLTSNQSRAHFSLYQAEAEKRRSFAIHATLRPPLCALIRLVILLRLCSLSDLFPAR